MKYRDKDGNVFKDIQQARRVLCLGLCMAEPDAMPCRECPVSIVNNGESVCCTTFVTSKPAEAARLMVYEIVEDAAPESLPQGCHPDPPGLKGPPCGCPVCGRVESIEWDGETDVSRCTHCGWSNGAFASKIKEVSMDKPLKDWTLGEVVAECNKHKVCEPSCPLCNSTDYGDGCRLCRGSDTPNTDWDLTDPPRFTEEEVADAAKLTKLFPEYWLKLKRYEDNDIKMVSGDGSVVPLVESAFPSILPGQTVKISDIAGNPNMERR